MNDHELEKLLRQVPVPEPSQEYWEDFPGQVRRQLRRRRLAPDARSVWRVRWVWAGDFALTAALVFLCLQYHPLQTLSNAITRHERACHAQIARWDVGLRRLMLNTGGMSYLLADAN